jgi:hypothetical protein
MNNSFVQRQAKSFAGRLLERTHDDVPEAIQLAYLSCYGRRPSDRELRHAADVAAETGLQNVCWALLNSTEFLYVR